MIHCITEINLVSIVYNNKYRYGENKQVLGLVPRLLTLGSLTGVR